MRDKPDIGIVGFGRFSALMCRYLAKDFHVRVYNRSDKAEEIRKIGATPVGFEDAAGQDIVIYGVPISVLSRILKKSAPLLKPGTMVVDVCSVKVFPIQWMRKYLPESVSILATHPMFGPDSAADDLGGRKIVLCRERISDEKYDAVHKYLAGKGLVVIETSAREHDRQIAVSLALTHFIGRALDEFGAMPLKIDTEGYQRLLHTLGVVSHDTWQLFEDMNRYNPYAPECRERFIRAMGKIDQRLTADKNGA